MQGVGFRTLQYSIVQLGAKCPDEWFI